MNSQRDYFKKQFEKNESQQHLWHELASLFVLAAIILALLTQVLSEGSALSGVMEDWWYDRPCMRLQFVMLISAAWAVVIGYGLWSESQKKKREAAHEHGKAKGQPSEVGPLCSCVQEVIHGLFPAGPQHGGSKHECHQPSLNKGAKIWCGVQWIINVLFPTDHRYPHPLKALTTRLVVAFLLALTVMAGCEFVNHEFVPHVHAQSAYHGENSPVVELVHLNHVALIGVGTLLLVGALAIAWRETRLFSEYSRQYHAMADLYASAGDRMHILLAQAEAGLKSKPDDISAHTRQVEGIRELLIALGREALDENAEWLILHRSRPLEPVHG